MVGGLFGLMPMPAERARVLELGCGDGGNLLSLAQALPRASFVGVDLAPEAIARGGELAERAGLRNAELRCADLRELPADLGEFDYILAHGVYSWITPEARSALLTAIRARLAPQGIAYVSYNAYPGSYLRDMARDILRYHVRGIEDPPERIAAAQELMRTIVAIEEPTPYARLLREHMERMLRYSDALLLHDDLAEIATPFYLYEFVEHAGRHGLEFLAEAELSESQMRGVPKSAARLMHGLAEDVVAREQYLDFLKNRMFRRTLLCHVEASVRRELDDRQVANCFASAQLEVGEEGGEGETFATPEGFTVTTSEPLARAALRALARAWPAALPFSELLSIAGDATGPRFSLAKIAERLRVVLLQAYLGRIVQLQSCAPLLSGREGGERPLASPLARAQCASGMPTVSSLLHANVRLEGELEPRLLGLLDGTRDEAALVRETAAGRDDVRAALERFAAVGLLCGA